MTKDDIIRMAREAGWPSMVIDNLPGTVDETRLQRFAALVTAAEREECAKICEGRLQHGLNFEGCAAAIRARGKQ